MIAPPSVTETNERRNPVAKKRDLIQESVRSSKAITPTATFVDLQKRVFARDDRNARMFHLPCAISQCGTVGFLVEAGLRNFADVLGRLSL